MTSKEEREEFEGTRELERMVEAGILRESSQFGGIFYFSPRGAQEEVPCRWNGSEKRFFAKHVLGEKYDGEGSGLPLPPKAVAVLIGEYAGVGNGGETRYVRFSEIELLMEKKGTVTGAQTVQEEKDEEWMSLIPAAK